MEAKMMWKIKKKMKGLEAPPVKCSTRPMAR
jgi:hypothetical protein